MKNFKKIMALIIAAVMIVGTMSSMAVFADETANTVKRDITIDGLDDGDVVTLYKVLSWAETSQEATENGAVSGWYFEAPFNTDTDNIAPTGDKGAAYLKAAINDKNQLYLTDKMANDIAQALNGETVDPTTVKVATAENGEVTFTFTPNQPADYTDYDGLYMAIVTPKDQNVVYNPVFVHIDSSNTNDSFSIIESSASYMNASEDQSGNIISGAAKKSRIKLEKEAHNSRDYTDTLDEDPDPVDDGDTTAPYDNLTFNVKTTIPGYGESFDYPVFTMTDKMNGLHLMYPGAANENREDAEGNPVSEPYAADILVKVGNDEYIVNTLTEEGVYENNVFKLTADADQYKIEFKDTFLKTVHVPTDVVVTYHAKVKEGENTNVIKEKNTVELQFSHDPTTESDQNKGGDKDYKKDVTNHYTFTIDANNLVGPNGTRLGESGSELVKVAVDKSGNPIFESWTWSNVGDPKTSGQQSPLKDAEFTLYGSTPEGGIDRTKVVGKATSDASGRINFTGLDAGKYWLEEDKAPAGYVKQSGQFPVVIEAEMEEKEITEYTKNGETWISQADYDALAENAQKEYQSFTYKTDELKSYRVIYGTEAAAYSFEHIHESKNDQIEWSIAESAEAPQSIVNTKGVELPSTGGIGTTLFYIIGAILVVGAGVVLVTRRRMSTN